MLHIIPLIISLIITAIIWPRYARIWLPPIDIICLRTAYIWIFRWICGANFHFVKGLSFQKLVYLTLIGNYVDRFELNVDKFIKITILLQLSLRVYQILSKKGINYLLPSYVRFSSISFFLLSLFLWFLGPFLISFLSLLLKEAIKRNWCLLVLLLPVGNHNFLLQLTLLNFLF